MNPAPYNGGGKATSMEKWVDYSKWQGRVGKDKLALMQADGVAGVCVGAWHGLDANPYAEANLRDAREIGLMTATYFIINNRPGAWTVQQAKAACGNEWYHLLFHASDVEVAGVTEAILQNALDETERLGGRPLIYTGGWFWNNLPFKLNFRRYPFWTSLYDGIADFNRNNVQGADIWVAKQYAGTTSAYGTKVDFNVFNKDWLYTIKENDMPLSHEDKVFIQVECQKVQNFVQAAHEVTRTLTVEQATRVVEKLLAANGAADDLLAALGTEAGRSILRNEAKWGAVDALTGLRVTFEGL